MIGNQKEEYRIRKKNGRLPVFFLTLFTLGVLTTIQFFILGKYIDYQSVDTLRVLLINGYWVIGAAFFTLISSYQIKHYYERPIDILAKGTKKVADGDFSVYLKPLHRPDRMDYIDAMFLDFNKMVEELGSIETLKTDFVSNVSHEMKLPISVIKNYAELIQSNRLSEEQRMEYAVSIEAAAGRLSDLVSNILRLNKLENQRMTPEAEVYDVCRQLCDCAIQFEDLWEKKGIELEVDIEDKAEIYADKNLMDLVWNNLLSNAIKFTEPGGTVFLRQSSTSKLVRISVSDTGCGIRKESIRHIFDKFYQGETSHSMEGNGLGLALVQRILQLMNGDIQVVSEQGNGSTFTVTLPAANAALPDGERQDEYEG